MNHRSGGGTAQAAVTLRSPSLGRVLVALAALITFVGVGPAGAQEPPVDDPGAAPTSIPEDDPGAAPTSIPEDDPGAAPTSIPEDDQSGAVPITGPEDEGAVGTQEPPGGDPQGSDPDIIPGGEVPVDEGAPLVDPVDPTLVDQVLAATARLTELDTVIAVTIQQVVEADAAIAVLTEDSADTRDSIAVTEDAIDARAADVARTRDRIGQLEDQLRDRIVDAFVAGSSLDDGWVGSTDVDEIDRHATRRAISESQAASDDRAAEGLRTERRRLDRQRDQLEAQRDRLDRHEADVAALQSDVTEARAERAELLVTLSADRAEAAELATEAQESLGVAMTFVADQLAALDAIGVDGTTGLPPVGFALDGQPLCDAAGIIVACAIAPEVAFMVAAAREDGVVLTGGGWRSTAQQIALRIAHCGGDAFGAPASACSPPTARPGSSQHEFGLAIDFADCASRTTPCHVWLAEHADGYGLKNLPSEPWHWSTTGS